MTKLRERLHGVARAGSGRLARIARRHNWLVEELTVMAEVAPGRDSPQPESQDLGARDQLGMNGFNGLLHQLRSCELARMPRITGTMLSAGCSDASYFTWINACYGPVERHLGVELYLPEPAGLPPGVEWLKSSVGNMTDVKDAAVALVFSGQNFEHLFDDDAITFLLEAHRVLEPGGWLVMDSPNREVTSALTWTQPQHTIEFTPAEAIDLVTLAGFDVVDVRGLWLCRDSVTGETLPLWGVGGADPPLAEVLQRSVLAGRDPGNSFVWWLEATRALREPDAARMRSRHAEIYARAWPERQQRFTHVIGERLERGARQVVTVSQGTSGYALFGPYMPLIPGHYRVTFTLRRVGAEAADQTLAILDVADDQGNVVIDRSIRNHELRDHVWTDIDILFTVETLIWGGQFRVCSTGAVALEILFGAVLNEENPPPDKRTGPGTPATVRHPAIRVRNL